MEAFRVPEMYDYVETKAEIYDLKKKLQTWRRKVDITTVSCYRLIYNCLPSVQHTELFKYYVITVSSCMLSLLPQFGPIAKRMIAKFNLKLLIPNCSSCCSYNALGKLCMLYTSVVLLHVGKSLTFTSYARGSKCIFCIRGIGECVGTLDSFHSLVSHVPMYQTSTLYLVLGSN